MSANPEGLVAEARHFATLYAYPEAKEHILALCDRLEAAERQREAEDGRGQEVLGLGIRLALSERQRADYRQALKEIVQLTRQMGPNSESGQRAHQLAKRALSSPEGATKGEG